MDIGYGILTFELGKIDISLEQLDKIIYDYVPAGYNVHGGRIMRFPKKIRKKYRCTWTGKSFYRT